MTLAGVLHLVPPLYILPMWYKPGGGFKVRRKASKWKFGNIHTPYYLSNERVLPFIYFLFVWRIITTIVVILFNCYYYFIFYLIFIFTANTKGWGKVLIPHHPSWLWKSVSSALAYRLWMQESASTRCCCGLGIRVNGTFWGDMCCTSA